MTYRTDEGRWGSLIELIMFFVFRGSRPGRPPIKVDDEDFSNCQLPCPSHCTLFMLLKLGTSLLVLLYYY